MARVTVEDCIEKVPNRFDLIILAAQRSRELTSGETNMVEIDNDKNPVVSLREIAEGHFTPDQLSAPIIAEMRRITPPEEIPGEDGLKARETSPANSEEADEEMAEKEDAGEEVAPSDMDDGEAGEEVAPPDIDDAEAGEEVAPPDIDENADDEEIPPGETN